ncbi:MAG: Ig-like domain-containing protein, partial [Candidatus Absconditabacteria bacterium]|nr:Ig-like domain-containing protein [Candidatus Absconditabacteria bacterium]
MKTKIFGVLLGILFIAQGVTGQTYVNHVVTGNVNIQEAWTNAAGTTGSAQIRVRLAYNIDLIGYNNIGSIQVGHPAWTSGNSWSTSNGAQLNGSPTDQYVGFKSTGTYENANYSTGKIAILEPWLVGDHLLTIGSTTQRISVWKQQYPNGKFPVPIGATVSVSLNGYFVSPGSNRTYVNGNEITPARQQSYTLSNYASSGEVNISVTTRDGFASNPTHTTDFVLDYQAPATIPVTGVTLNKSATTLTVGADETLVATVNPSNATDKSVSWSSSNTSVATVSATGTVTAIAAGSATITVKTNDGNKTAST